MKSKNTILDVRDLQEVKPKYILDNLKGGLEIRFEDNIVVKMKMKDIVISRYYWEILYKYPVVIDSNFIVSKYYKNNMYSSDTHLNFLYQINKKIIADFVKHKDDKNNLMSDVYELIHDTVELLYSELAAELKEYTMSIDAVDMLEIQFRPEIMESIENVRKEMSAESVKLAHDIFEEVVRDEALRDNPAVIAYLSGAVNSGQMKSMLTSNGFKTDATGKIFPYPIASSFMLGMDNMYEVLIESRTAVKALYLSTRAIQSTETLAKELQLLAMYIERLRINDDCRSTDYVEWFVDEGKKDLDNLLGSYYLNENNRLEVITEDHKHLIGTKIKIRNAISCKHWDKHAVCGVCFGDLAYQISATSNLGHYSGVNPTGQTTQLSLKTKHQQDSALAETVVLNDISQLFFTIKNKNTYCIKNIKIDNKTKMYIEAPQEFLHSIKDVTMENINKIDIFRVSKIPFFDLIVKKENNEESSYRINIQIGNRIGVVTQKMLAHLTDESNYEIVDGNKYRIDITKLKENTPIVTLPDIEYNYLSLALDLKSLLKKVTLKDNPHTFLGKLYNLINSKLKINVAYIGVLVRALMINDLKTNNFDLPSSDNENPQIAKMVDVIRGRSLPNSLVLGYATMIMTSAYSFVPDNRPNSKLDVLFKPREAIYYAKKRKAEMKKREHEMKRGDI